MKRKLHLREKVAIFGFFLFLMWIGLFFINPIVALFIILGGLILFSACFLLMSVTMLVLAWVYDWGEAEYTPELARKIIDMWDEF